MYRWVLGSANRRVKRYRLAPSPSHARNALARAAQFSDRLTAREYETIIRRANSVLAKCGEGSTMATKKKKKATKKRATKKRPAKKKPARAKKRATKKRPAKKKPAAKKRAKKKKHNPGPPAALADLKRGDRFRELSNKQIAIYTGHEGSGAALLVRMKDAGKDPLHYKISVAELKKYFKPIASRKAANGAKNGNGNGPSVATASRERSIRSMFGF